MALNKIKINESIYLKTEKKEENKFLIKLYASQNDLEIATTTIDDFGQVEIVTINDSALRHENLIKKTCKDMRNRIVLADQKIIEDALFSLVM